jgi:SOS-response transcriptional repressor LexA
MAKNRVQAIPLSSFDTSGLTTSYQVIDSAGLDAACFLVRITNDSNVDITVSLDGTNNNEYLVAGDAIVLPVQTNSQPGGWVSLLPKGQKFYVKGPSAGTGSVYLSGYYVAP